MCQRLILILAVLICGLFIVSPVALAQEQAPAPAVTEQAPAEGETTPGATETPAQAEPQQQEAQQPQQPPAGPADQFQRPHDSDQLPKRVAEIIARLDKVEETLTRENLSSGQLDRLRRDVDESLAELGTLIEEIRPQLEAVSNQLEKLGEPPGEDQPAEPQAIAAERASLQARANRLESTLKAAQASQVRANQLNERVQNRRRDLFTSQLFERTTTPLSLSLWQRAAAENQTAQRRFRLLLEDSMRGVESNETLYAILFFGIVIFGLLQAVGWFGVKHFREWEGDTPPPFWQRASSGAWVIILRALPIMATAGALYGMLAAADLLVPRMDEIARAVTIALATVAIVSALSTTILAPNRPQWRILPVNDSGATRVNRLVLAIAAVFGIDKVVSTINEVLWMPLSTTIAQTSATNVLFAVLFAAVLMTRMGTEEGEEDSQVEWLSWLRIPGYALVLTILLATAAGYVAFGRFLAAQVVITGSIVIVVYLMLVWVNAVGDRIRSGQAGPRGIPALPSDNRRRDQIALVLTLALKALIFAVAFPIILLQWGFDWKDLTGWSQKLFFGFQVGGLNVSLATLVGAVLVFILAYGLARVLLSWMDNQVMEPAGLSGGVRDSVRTGLGYVGFIAAVLVAASYAGLDFSNLAIVAGALSVGIGFGLQSIVNNFVSGLILLAERPIKVGDWVVVGQDQGFVRKISVRSTEIETFDRANVVVPNSVLISEKVQNWTLHNNVGRISINVGVSYDSDPERVKDILLEVAREHPQVLTHPEPYVWFSDFGNSSLDFTLFAYALNITRQLGIQTDLRIAIVKKFREEGIEIPYPQSDVHFRDLDWLKTALAEQMARVREERESGEAVDGSPYPQAPGGDAKG
jgi:small-conductance mechanosensitive channel